MSLHRRAAKRDAAEPEIVKTLEAHGCIVWRLSGKGLADLQVFYRKRIGVKSMDSTRHTFVADVKGPKEKATPAQEEKWGTLTALGFAVFILRTPEDAVKMLNNALHPWEPALPRVTARSTLRAHIKAASTACSCPPNWCTQDPPCSKAIGNKAPSKGDAAKAREDGRKRMRREQQWGRVMAEAAYTPPHSKPVDAAKEAGETFAPPPRGLTCEMCSGPASVEYEAGRWVCVPCSAI